MDRSRPRWWRLVLALPPTIVAAVCLARSWQGILGSHPAYGVTLVVVLVVGAVLVLSALRPRPVWRDDDEPRAGVARRVLAWTGRLVALAGVLLLTVALWWLQPFPAQEVRLAAAGQGDGVDITTSYSRIELEPAGRQAGVGLVFYPGARVDPRAYIPLLSRVAAQGYRVVIVKPPYGIAMLSPGAPTSAIKAWPKVARWVVGGHSLGGVVAAQYVGQQAGQHEPKLDGLLLWASYPAKTIASAPVQASSIFGTRDGLTTVSDVEASRANLPPTTVFVPVKGAVHAYFGDYGAQPGDGRPTISRAQAQDQIVAATVAMLKRISSSGAG